jgi:hypothetical protein
MPDHFYVYIQYIVYCISNASSGDFTADLSTFLVAMSLKKVKIVKWNLELELFVLFDGNKSPSFPTL